MKSFKFCNIISLQKENNVYDQITQIVNDWQNIIKEEKDIQAWDWKLYPIGSYALGVLDIDSDIDWVLVAPTEFTRDEDFFVRFLRMLKLDPHVSDILSLPDAYVPIIKFKYLGWSVDIQFANYEDWSDFGIFSEFLSLNLDKSSILAINSIHIIEKLK